MKVQRETEISILKSFKAASEGCVEEFNGKLGELLVETHGMVGVVRGFYGGGVKDKFFEFEGAWCVAVRAKPSEERSDGLLVAGRSEPRTKPSEKLVACLHYVFRYVILTS